MAAHLSPAFPSMGLKTIYGMALFTTRTQHGEDIVSVSSERLSSLSQQPPSDVLFDKVTTDESLRSK